MAPFNTLKGNKDINICQSDRQKPKGTEEYRDTAKCFHIRRQHCGALQVARGTQVKQSYFMLRNMRRVWLVFMVARATSSVEIRCRRVLGFVWRTLLLCSPRLSQTPVRCRCTVSMGITCWRTERLANWSEGNHTNKWQRTKGRKQVKILILNWTESEPFQC